MNLLFVQLAISFLDTFSSESTKKLPFLKLVRVFFSAQFHQLHSALVKLCKLMNTAVFFSLTIYRLKKIMLNGGILAESLIKTRRQPDHFGKRVSLPCCGS